MAGRPANRPFTRKGVKVMIVHLTKQQIQHLRNIVLEDMENHGYDGQEPELLECAAMLDELENAQEEK